MRKTFILGGGAFAALLMVGVMALFLMVARVPAGHVGVVYSAKGVDEQVKGVGLHLLNPFKFEKMINYPTKMQTAQYKNIAVATSDGKNVEMDLAYNFTIDSTKAVSLYNKFGAVKVEGIVDSFLRTRLWDSARQNVSKYNIIEIYGEKSSEASKDILESFSTDVKDLGFTIENLTLGVPKPDESTQTAINERVKATQELERKQTEVKIAEQEAHRKKVEAQGIKEANEEITKSLTPELLQEQAIKKWNGQLPTITGSNENLIQIPLPNK